MPNHLWSSLQKFAEGSPMLSDTRYRTIAFSVFAAFTFFCLSLLVIQKIRLYGSFKRADIKLALCTEVVWTPSPFCRPKAPPYPEWSIQSTKPLAYRPFRHKYFQTMGIRSMNWDDWIQLDNQFLSFHDQKVQRIADRGDKCCRTHPDALDAAMELLMELRDYLTERYPGLYQRTEGGMRNLATAEEFDIVEKPLKEDPMQIAARWVQDDLAIMVPRRDVMGQIQYYLMAGCILLPGFWRLEDKYMKTLSDVHTSGDVPQFKEKLEKGMVNLFRRMKPESPVERNNYFIQVDDELAWSYSIGSEDSKPGEFGWFSAEKDKIVENHWFRSERQTLRRLPRSGGIVFTIRTYFHPIMEISEEPYVPGRLASGIRSWGDDVSHYKGKERYGDVLLEYLDKKNEEQLVRGLQPEKEDEHHVYPY